MAESADGTKSICYLVVGHGGFVDYVSFILETISIPGFGIGP